MKSACSVHLAVEVHQLQREAVGFPSEAPLRVRPLAEACRARRAVEAPIRQGVAWKVAPAQRGSSQHPNWGATDRPDSLSTITLEVAGTVSALKKLGNVSVALPEVLGLFLAI